MRENSLLSNLAVAYATYIASTSVSTVILQFVYNILRDLARMRSQARLHIFYIPAQFLPLFFTNDATVFIWTTFYGH